MASIIKNLNLENQTVLDPMMGSYITEMTTLNHKRFIGIKIDRETFLIANSRLANKYD